MAREHPEDIVKDVNDFAELCSLVISSLAAGWRKGEADLTVEIRDSEGVIKAKVRAGVTHRIG